MDSEFLTNLVNASSNQLLSQQSSDASPFASFEYDYFRNMPAQELQLLFRTKHILVHGVPYTNLDFDRRGLSTLGAWNEPRSFQGKIFVINTCLYHLQL